MLSRRSVLLGSVAAGVTLLPADNVFRPAHPGPAAGSPGDHHGHAHGVARSVAPAAVEPFTVPLPIPPVLRPVASVRDVDFYSLSAQRVTEQILPGVDTEVFAYGRSFVAPTIRTRRGRRVVVCHTNRLDAGTAVHLHGGHTAASSDGFPTDVVEPGARRFYSYDNRQPAATLWYHDHAHHAEAEHVYRGLHGFYLIDDPAEDALGLPRGRYDVPLMVRDARFGEDGSLVFVTGDGVNRTTFLVNGRPTPFLRVAARRYRLRLLNAANLRIFRLQLGSGEQLTQIGGDGGLLPAPWPTGVLTLSPGERADVVVDFGAYPSGTQLVLTDLVSGAPVMRFDVGAAVADPSRVPAVLRPSAELAPAVVTRDVTLSFDAVNKRFVIDGKEFDPTRVDLTIPRGQTEIWRVTNAAPPPVPHNLHLHSLHFRVLDRNGNAPSPGEAGPKDTVLVAPGETVRIQATFDRPGKFVYHCHMLDHSSTGQMAVMNIVG